MRLALVLPCLALLGLSALAQERPKRDPLVLTYLANEGFLAAVGEESVLFDSFLSMPYAGYPALPAETLQRLQKAKAPFDGVELAVTSHNHGDHFQQSVARDFLLASPATQLVTTPQTLGLLAQAEGWPKDQVQRLLGRYPKAGETAKRSFGEIEVELLRIPHGGMPDVQNLGTIVRVGGHTILHLGDADTDPDHFLPYAQQLAEVDLVLAPVWFFTTGAGKAILKESLPAKARVAMHFAKRELKKTVESFVKGHPGVVAFPKPLLSHTFP